MQGYIEQVLDDFGMSDCKSSPVPGTSLEILFGIVNEAESSKPRGAISDDSHPQLQLSNYRSGTGCLQWATQLYPVITDAVSKLAQFNQDPKPHHLKALKKILRFLSGYRTSRITYTGADLSQPLQFVCYSDADWAGDTSDRKSTTGWIILLCGAAVSWCSKKQPTTAKSTMESEYIAASSIVSEIKWMRNFMDALNCKQTQPTIIHMDNTSAIAVANGGGSFRTSKTYRCCTSYINGSDSK